MLRIPNGRCYGDFLKPFLADKSQLSVPMKKGPGGRSSTTGRIVTVFGCTGFLGRYIVHALGKLDEFIIS